MVRRLRSSSNYSTASPGGAAGAAGAAGGAATAKAAMRRTDGAGVGTPAHDDVLERGPEELQPVISAFEGVELPSLWYSKDDDAATSDVPMHMDSDLASELASHAKAADAPHHPRGSLRQRRCGMIVGIVMTAFFIGSLVAVNVRASLYNELCPLPAVQCADGFKLVSDPIQLWKQSCVPTIMCNASQLLVPGRGCVAGMPCGESRLSPTSSCADAVICVGGWDPSLPCTPTKDCGSNTQMFTGNACVEMAERCKDELILAQRFAVPISTAFGAPLVVFFVQWALSSRRRQQNPSRRMPLLMWLTQHSLYEAFQLGVSVVSCASFLIYIDSVKVDSITSSDGTLYRIYNFIDGPSALSQWLSLEIFVVISYTLDYLLRLAATPLHRIPRRVFTFYSVVDVLSFITVVYPPFFEDAWAAVSPYSLFMLVGPLRFLRVRRAVQSLDNVRHGHDVKFGPIRVSAHFAAIAVLGVNAMLYVWISASIIIFCEFPCAVIDSTHGSCSAQFQDFNSVVYFVLVSYATIGYGDMVLVTTTGRNVMCLLIIFMLVFFPIQINRLASYFSDSSQLDAIQAKLNVMADQIRINNVVAAAQKRGRASSLARVGMASAKMPGPAAVPAQDYALTRRWLVSRIVTAAPPELLKKLCLAMDAPFSSVQDSAELLVEKLVFSAGDTAHQQPQQQQQPPTSSPSSSPSSFDMGRSMV